MLGCLCQSLWRWCYLDSRMEATCEMPGGRGKQLIAFRCLCPPLESQSTSQSILMSAQNMEPCHPPSDASWEHNTITAVSSLPKAPTLVLGRSRTELKLQGQIYLSQLRKAQTCSILASYWKKNKLICSRNVHDLLTTLPAMPRAKECRDRYWQGNLVFPLNRKPQAVKHKTSKL